jgi:hypothetical protein
LTKNPFANIVKCCRRLEGWQIVNDDPLAQIPFCCNPAKDTFVQFTLISPIKIGVFQCYCSTFIGDNFFIIAKFHIYLLVDVDVLRGTKVQISGFNFAAAKPNNAKPQKPSKAGNGSEKRMNAIPQAREAREANARE